ncbi:hypothetical protein GUJ93_ZPchr0010g10055 [Zizania palustris]|uniref:Uncharacterized protein n=1 Tax=Zizania palustris TaxID=103762 RepID=A0A8J5WBK5_ZIZPA|nr:hypothetical protein GUJ93_ZPchr0010g10055 [Zizania palustris]
MTQGMTQAGKPTEDRETSPDTLGCGPTRDRPQHHDVILAVQSPNRPGFPPPRRLYILSSSLAFSLIKPHRLSRVNVGSSDLTGTTAESLMRWLRHLSILVHLASMP